MPIYVYVAALAIAGSLLLLWWGFSGPTEKNLVQDNLAHGADLRADFREMQLSRSFNERLLQPVISVLGGRFRRLTPGGVIDATSRRVELAGLSTSWSVERVLAAQFGLVAVVGILSLVRLATTRVSGPTIAVIILLVVAAYLVPEAILARLAATSAAS